MLKKMTKYLQVAAEMLCKSEDCVKITCTTRDWCNSRCCISTVYIYIYIYVGRVMQDKLERMGSQVRAKHDDWRLNVEAKLARCRSV